MASPDYDVKEVHLQLALLHTSACYLPDCHVDIYNCHQGNENNKLPYLSAKQKATGWALLKAILKSVQSVVATDDVDAIPELFPVLSRQSIADMLRIAGDNEKETSTPSQPDVDADIRIWDQLLDDLEFIKKGMNGHIAPVAAKQGHHAWSVHRDKITCHDEALTCLFDRSPDTGSLCPDPVDLRFKCFYNFVLEVSRYNDMAEVWDLTNTGLNKLLPILPFTHMLRSLLVAPSVHFTQSQWGPKDVLEYDSRRFYDVYCEVAEVISTLDTYEPGELSAYAALLKSWSGRDLNLAK